MNSCDSVFLNNFRFVLLQSIRIVYFMYLFLHMCDLTRIHVVHVFVFCKHVSVWSITMKKK